jgi:hypothetical protein
VGWDAGSGGEGRDGHGCGRKVDGCPCC